MYNLRKRKYAAEAEGKAAALLAAGVQARGLAASVPTPRPVTPAATLVPAEAGGEEAAAEQPTPAKPARAAVSKKWEDVGLKVGAAA